MAKQSKIPRIQLQGVTNYDKLKNLKDKDFNKFNPFIDNTYSKQAKRKHEAESLDMRYLDEDVYNQMMMFSSGNMNRRLGTNLSYYGMSRKQKRVQLQRLSIHNQIDEVLTKLCDELVVQDDDTNPISLLIKKDVLEKSKMKESVINQITEYAGTEFDRICKMMGIFQDGTLTSLWNKVYCFMVEGDQAYEIVWDNIMNPKKIIAIHEIDALETESFYVQGIQYWKHHKRLSRQQESIILYDTQVSYISWSAASPNSRTSYTEQLLKPFNDLRIVDESTVTWTLTNSVFRMLFKVPGKNKSRSQALQTLATEKNRYHDDISYDSFTGDVNINGRPNLQMMKEYWMIDGDAGSPEVSAIGGEGPDLNDTTRNEYFERKFYKASNQPYSRFDNSGATWNIDPRSQLRDEISFGRFCSRSRSIIGQIILKPLYLAIVARFPELKGDDAILDALKLRWNSYNVFEELMEMDIMNEKIDAITKMNESFVLNTPDGGELKYFALDFLIEKYLPELTEEDRKRNAKLLLTQNEKLYQHQITQYILQTIYDPMANLDPETGLPDTEAITALAKEVIKSKILKKGLDKAEEDAKKEKEEMAKKMAAQKDAEGEDETKPEPENKPKPENEQLES